MQDKNPSRAFIKYTVQDLIESCTPAMLESIIFNLEVHLKEVYGKNKEAKQKAKRERRPFPHSQL